MPTPTLADDVREQRSDARTKLGKLAGVVEQIDSTNSVLDQLMARRLTLWRGLRALDPPVSWADIGRVSGVSEVTVIQAVNGRKPT